jgi:hypothetical protein
MKAIQLPAAQGKWAIDLEFGEWSIHTHVWRTGGDTGTTIYFDTKAEAEAQIAVLEAGGEQARIFKHDPVKIATAIAEDTAKRRGRPKNG